MTHPSRNARRLSESPDEEPLRLELLDLECELVHGEPDPALADPGLERGRRIGRAYETALGQMVLNSWLVYPRRFKAK